MVGIGGTYAGLKLKEHRIKESVILIASGIMMVWRLCILGSIWATWMQVHTIWGKAFVSGFCNLAEFKNMEMDKLFKTAGSNPYDKEVGKKANTLHCYMIFGFQKRDGWIL